MIYHRRPTRSRCQSFVYTIHMRTSLITGIVIMSGMLLLVGCGWGDSSTTQISFDHYLMDIPATYVNVPPVLVENKQLLHKVIKSFKVRAETIGDFESNIIISRSNISPELDFEQFRTLNTQQLGNMLAWYIPGDKELTSFVCNNQDVQWIFATFSVEDPRYKNAQRTWLAQYQFVNDGKWYIISAAYLTQKEQKNLKDIINTLVCTSTSMGSNNK